MSKPYLLMTTCSHDSDGITWGCDLALFCLDEPFRALLRRRVATLREVYGQDASVHELLFWATSQVKFYDQSAIDAIGLTDAEEALLDEDAFVFLDRAMVGAPRSDGPREQSVELTQLTLRLNAGEAAGGPPVMTVLWSTVPMDTDAIVLTAQVPAEAFGLC